MDVTMSSTFPVWIKCRRCVAEHFHVSSTTHVGPLNTKILCKAWYCRMRVTRCETAAVLRCLRGCFVSSSKAVFCVASMDTQHLFTARGVPTKSARGARCTWERNRLSPRRSVGQSKFCCGKARVLFVLPDNFGSTFTVGKILRAQTTARKTPEKLAASSLLDIQATSHTNMHNKICDRANA